MNANHLPPQPPVNTVSIWRAVIGNTQTTAYHTLSDHTLLKLNTFTQRSQPERRFTRSALSMIASCVYSAFLVSLACIIPGLGLATFARNWNSSLFENLIIFACITISFLAFWSGITFLAGRIAIGAKQYQATAFWNLLLLLPHDRGELVLVLINHAYHAGPLTVSLLLTEMCAFLLNGPALIFPLVAVLVLYEWLQWNVLGINKGLWAGNDNTPAITVVAFSLAASIFRAGSGLIIAIILDIPVLLPVMVGPLSIIRPDPPSSVIAGLVLGLMYLGLLELTVRQTFTAAVARLGER